MLVLYCSKDFCKKSAVSCTYLCKNSDKKHCESWLKNVDRIEEEYFDPKYIARYGEPKFYRRPEPKKRVVDKPKLIKKVILEEPKKSKKEDTNICAKQTQPVTSGINSSKTLKKEPKQPTVITVEGKRKRRTKAEMLAAKSKPEEKPKRKQRSDLGQKRKVKEKK